MIQISLQNFASKNHCRDQERVTTFPIFQVSCIDDYGTVTNQNWGLILMKELWHIGGLARY